MATIPYIPGFDIKPKSTSNLGYVTFTDGTNDMMPNQLQCEAYGYTYDKATGTCRAFNYSTNLQPNITNESNRIEGSGNTATSGAINTYIIGEKNTVNGDTRNNLIVGSKNEISNDDELVSINNIAILGGTYANALRNGEVVIGGGVALGINQTSTVQLGGNTEDATATKLTVQSDESSWVAVQNNSIFAFEIKVIALCSGGTSGTAGDYAYLELKGAIQVDDGYNLVISQSSTTIASVGTTGEAQVITAGVDPYITVEVTGTADIVLEWFASIQITEKKLRTGTF